MVEVYDHRVAVEDKNLVVVVVEHYYDEYYVVENHMMIDLMDHMDEKVVEVYDQHLNDIRK
jgi:hypothetical protein